MSWTRAGDPLRERDHDRLARPRLGHPGGGPQGRVRGDRRKARRHRRPHRCPRIRRERGATESSLAPGAHNRRVGTPLGAAGSLPCPFLARGARKAQIERVGTAEAGVRGAQHVGYVQLMQGPFPAPPPERQPRRPRLALDGMAPMQMVTPTLPATVDRRTTRSLVFARCPRRSSSWRCAAVPVSGEARPGGRRRARGEHQPLT